MRFLFVDIDTLRADHLSCYGYHRHTTPNFDAVAEQGVIFNQYYCSDAPCLPSRAALVSGMFGIRNGVVGHGGTAADKRYMGEPRDFRSWDDDNNLHNVFRKAGFNTVSISTFPERHSAWWFNAGFKETYNVGRSGGESGEEVIPVALDWLNRHGNEDNWFLHVHLWDPHNPYRAPESFGNPFKDDPLPAWLTEEVFNQHLKHVGPHGLNEFNMYDDNEIPGLPRYPGKATDMAGLRKILDGYDCGVAYADMMMGKVFDRLRELGIYDDTAIIITSDHGENMGEFGIYGEHGTADYATCHIPMIFKWPGGAKGKVDNGLHYNLDLAPTLTDLLNVERNPKWDGESYADTVLTGKNEGRPSLVISQMAHVCQRSARFDKWLYIRTYHDGYHLFDDEMLFDLENDPYEQNDVKEKYPEICAQGAKIILDWHDAEMKRSESQIDPLWTVYKEGGPFHARGHLESYCKRLEVTGRAEGAAKLREKYKNFKWW